jgi:hypothetical protein
MNQFTVGAAAPETNPRTCQKKRPEQGAATMLFHAKLVKTTLTTVGFIVDDICRYLKLVRY